VVRLVIARSADATSVYVRLSNTEEELSPSLQRSMQPFVTLAAWQPISLFGLNPCKARL
jgi:hypothetical protein